MSTQLPLHLSLPQSATFNAFVADDNILLVSLIQHMSQHNGEQQLYFWGDEGTGKTHLLQAACHESAKLNFSCAYLPLSELLNYGSELLEDLHKLHLICIDGLQSIAGLTVWETALFNLINQVRSSNTRLIISGSAAAPALGVGLKDLVSRLTWGPVFHLKNISDANKVLVLQKRAASRGLVLTEEVGNYMLSRYKRNMNYLCEQLDHLDKASMVAQRPLTIPFVKSVMDKVS